MQTELVGRCRTWDSRTQFADAMFEGLEVFSDRQHRNQTLDCKTPVAYDTHRPIALPVRTQRPNPRCLLNGGNPSRLGFNDGRKTTQGRQVLRTSRPDSAR